MSITNPSPRMMPSVTAVTGIALSAAISFFNTGCASSPGAHTVETGSSQTIVSVDQINDQDWSNAATKLTNSMLSQDGLFARNTDGTKKRLAISRIINNTREIVDVDLLVKQIRVPLINAGKVVVTTVNGASVEDQKAKDERDRIDLSTGDGTGAMRLVDYTLSGKLIENHVTAGDVRQSTFYFQMSLTDTRSGDSVWEQQVPITKIGAHNSVGL